MKRTIGDISHGRVDVLKTESLRLGTVFIHSQRHSFNNRRLKAFKKAGCESALVRHYPLHESFTEPAQDMPVTSKIVVAFDSTTNGHFASRVVRPGGHDVYPLLADLAELIHQHRHAAELATDVEVNHFVSRCVHSIVQCVDVLMLDSQVGQQYLGLERHVRELLSRIWDFRRGMPWAGLTKNVIRSLLERRWAPRRRATFAWRAFVP